MEFFKNMNGKIIVMNLVKTIQENKEYLSEVDGLIGDGDHGINMNKGFTICEERIKEKDINLTESLKILSSVLLTEIGGSMGPLYGSFFRGMSNGCKDKEEIDAVVVMNMLQTAYEKVSGIGDAKAGDKTMMDALIPAVVAYRSALEAKKSLRNCLEDMRLAAEKGKNSTIDMVAKIGRAARLGERSRGVLDAGATSCALILNSFALSVEDLIK